MNKKNSAGLNEDEDEKRKPHPNPLPGARGLRHRGMFSIVSHRNEVRWPEGEKQYASRFALAGLPGWEQFCCNDDEDVNDDYTTTWRFNATTNCSLSNDLYSTLCIDTLL